MTSKLDRAKQQENYREFMALKDKEEVLSFLSRVVPNPVGKPYFTPMDYRWATMALRAELYESHARRWNSLWGLFHSAERQESDLTFKGNESVLIGVMVRKTDHLADWVESRYDNIGMSYTRADMFSYAEWESPESWEKDNNLNDIQGSDANVDYEVLYYWQEVKPVGEPTNDGRRHCILVDRVTHQEAPLLPGQEPFPR